MRTFDEFYSQLQSTDDIELNKAWQEAKKENKKAKRTAGIVCLIIDVLGVILFLKSGVNINSLLYLFPIIITALVINLFIIVIINMLFNKNQKMYNEKYKKIVINKLINNFYNNLEYFPQKSMPEYIYRELKYEYYNRYKSDDYFEALIDNKYNIQMAEILTQKEETYRDSDGDSHTRIITKFHGLFAKIIMDKSINSELKIVQDGKVLLNNKLKMDSSEFEKYFDVNSSNKIIGMQLLTSDVMDELVQFQNKTNMKFDIYIKSNELYLRFHSGTMFEVGKLKNGALNKETIQKYFYMLNFTYNLSNKLINIINSTPI